MEFITEGDRIIATDDNDNIIAEVDFPVQGDTAVITHTFVDPSLRGQGVAAQLIEAALQEIRDRGLKAEPVCSYARRYFAEHPEAVADVLG